MADGATDVGRIIENETVYCHFLCDVNGVWKGKWGSTKRALLVKAKPQNLDSSIS